MPSTNSPRWFSADLLPKLVSPRPCIIVKGSSCAGAGLHICPYWISWGGPIPPRILGASVWQHIDCPLSFCVIWELHKQALCHLLQVIDKDVKHNTSQDRSLWHPSCYQPWGRVALEALPSESNHPTTVSTHLVDRYLLSLELGYLQVREKIFMFWYKQPEYPFPISSIQIWPELKHSMDNNLDHAQERV